MKEDYDNFIKWFKEPLKCLYQNDDAGFIILMVSLPLLERYLREKSGVHEGNLNDSFYKKFVEMFPSVNDKGIAKKFWQIYRNGLLHQATLSLKAKNGTIILAAGGHGDAPKIKYDGYGAQGEMFTVSPRKFSEKVILTIESDFATFEGMSSANHPLAQILPDTGISGWSGNNPSK
jgi:hypothetical protein